MMKKEMDTLEFLSQDVAARMGYVARMKALSDEKSRVEGAKAEANAETAARLLAMGIDIQIIAEATGLPVKKILA